MHEARDNLFKWTSGTEYSGGRTSQNSDGILFWTAERSPDLHPLYCSRHFHAAGRSQRHGYYSCRDFSKFHCRCGPGGKGSKSSGIFKADDKSYCPDSPKWNFKRNSGPGSPAWRHCLPGCRPPGARRSGADFRKQPEDWRSCTDRRICSCRKRFVSKQSCLHVHQCNLWTWRGYGYGHWHGYGDR